MAVSEGPKVGPAGKNRGSDGGVGAADSAGSVSEGFELRFIPQICERKTRNHPLTDAQKASNKQKSHIRIRVEHVFGHMTPTDPEKRPF